jgi:hypothetical protein
MNTKKTWIYLWRSPAALSMLVIFVMVAACAGQSIKKAEAKTPAITEADLQKDLMGFADRFASYLFAGLRSYEATAGMEWPRAVVQRDVLLASTSAFTIAADRNPAAALLDMAAMVTMGRLIYEEYWLPKHGEAMRPVLEAYRKGENDIWTVTGQILDESQQTILIGLIRQWREENPDHTGFAYLRFGYMAENWEDSGSAEAKKAGGLFQSVRDATQQVEEARLLAERGMYLATRLPVLSGSFADYWMADFSKNPEVGKLLADLHGLAQTFEKLPGVISEERSATVRQSMDEISAWSRMSIEQTMDRVAVERRAAIEQVFSGLQEQRKDVLEDLIREQESVSGLLKEIRATLSEGNQALATASGLAERFAPEPGEGKSDTPPMTVEDYRALLVEVNGTIKELGGLLAVVDEMSDSPRWKAMEQVIASGMDQAGKEGEQLIDHSFRRGLLLIAAGIAMFLLAQVAFFYFKRRVGP